MAVPTEMDRIAESAGAVSYDRVFQKLASSESEICRFGLDRWYTLTFAPETDLRQAVELLSKEDGIERIQYNNRLKGLEEMKSASWKPAPATKATSNILPPFNDPALASQWHYHSTQKGKPVDTSVPGSDINVYDAWKLTTGDPSIIVAVVDEGVAYNHPDLAANMWKNEKEIPGNGIDDDGNGYVDDVYGYNFSMDEPQISWNKLRSSSGGVRDQGHGTHVAGVVAAVNNNNVGISGIAGGSGKGDGVRIMSCQIYSGGQNCTEEYLAKAIRYAADNGASILQCSWGFQAGADLSDKSYKTRQPLVYAAIEYFENADRKELGFDNPINGGVAFFAAGNDGKEMSAYPGALADIISVTAFASDYKPTGYTNYGPGCNIAAPGGEFYYTSSDGNTYICDGCVLSTMPEGYIYSTDYDGKGYGYLAGPYVRDKDAVIGSMLICEMAAYYRSIGSSIKQRLEEIYAQYGRYLNKVDSFEFPGLTGMEKMASIMQKLRDQPPVELAGHKVVKVTDYKKPEETGLPAANVLIYTLENGATVVVRPSGTEPKIKTYFTTLGKDLAEAQAQKDALAAAIEPILK